MGIHSDSFFLAIMVTKPILSNKKSGNSFVVVPICNDHPRNWHGREVRLYNSTYSTAGKPTSGDGSAITSLITTSYRSISVWALPAYPIKRNNPHSIHVIQFPLLISFISPLFFRKQKYYFCMVTILFC